jgi:diguanylate cyclase (GGDEF)-like protein
VHPVRWFAAVGMVCVVVYAFAGSSVLGDAAFLIVGIGGCASMVAGPRLHRTRPDRPWRLIGAASAVFLVGALVRPWAAQQQGGLMALADAFTLPGYALLVAGIAALLRARNSVDGQAVLDGLIVGLGAGLLSLTVFSLPAVQVSDRPPLVSALAGVYPLLDVVLLLLLVNLAFTTAVRQVSFGLLAAGVVLLLIGDLGYAVIGARGELSGPTWLDLPFLGCYVLFGCAALHPSMVKLGRAVPRAVQAWSWRRLVLIVPALVTPFVLVMLGSRTPAERIAIGAVGTAMMALLLMRAAAAVGAYARAEKVFRFQAIHDGLTGLPNRAAAVAAIGQLLAQQELGRRPLWVFLLNLDGFKAVNDSWGHDAGDRLLVDVGRRLRQATPAVGSVARLGGDEFAVAVPAWDHEAAVLGEQLMAVLAQPLQGGGAEIVVSASVGMARAEDGHTAEGLLLDADAAMYRAKAEGRRRRVVFDPSMRRHVRERSELEQALRRAVTRGELRLAYQPIVRIADGALVGAEALLRWDHPDRGPIPPDTFVPVAEEAGLISEIGEWALVEALTVTTAWRRAQLVAPDFWMSVNVSPRQLRDNRVLDTVRRALADTGLPSTALVLEITESVMLDESEATEEVLQQLRALGVRLVVDDFGTGFSALGYLRRHPVTGVKIDRSFVDGLGRDPEDEEIIRAVVAMSSALGLSIVAEGVETPLQREALLSLGVTLAQGWLWARAVTTAEFADRYGGGHPLPTGPSAAGPAAEVSTAPAPAGGNS